MSKKSVCVIGLGYIGLPTSALLANRGYSVFGVDVNKNVVDIINQGKIHIVEPDLDTFVRAAVESGRLKAHTQPVSADVYMICVPTPFLPAAENAIPTPDLSYVVSATESIASFLKPGSVVILESTSPVGTTEKMREVLKAKGVDTDKVLFAYCPERVLPGKIMHELVNNDRIVGGLTEEATRTVASFYEDFITGQVFLTNARTAEMTKLTENSFRDVNIAFANEISILCDKFGINPWELIKLANRHPRVNILQPGPGVGGHCISVDPWFLVHPAPEEARLIHAARTVNNFKPLHVLRKISDLIAGNEKLKVGFLGLAFKANIDDLRESPAIEIVEHFVHTNKNPVRVCEPNVTELPKSLSSKGLVNSTLADLVQECDLVVLLVDHDEFKKLSKEKLANKKIIDTRGVWQ